MPQSFSAAQLKGRNIENVALKGKVTGKRSHDADFTIALLPDTQITVQDFQSVWDDSITYLLSQKTTMNIQAVIGLGDIQNDAAVAANWTKALAGWDQIKAAGIPYLPTIGNHDYTANVTRDATDWNTHFGESYFSGKTWFGGSYNSGTENYYVKLDIGSYKYLILVLEFIPRRLVLAWAQGVLDANPDREVILETHAYLASDGQRLLRSQADSSDTYYLTAATDVAPEELWHDFIKINTNIFLVLSGHAGGGVGGAYRQDVNDGGRVVHQFKFDMQNFTYGGYGGIVFMKVSPSTGKIQFRYWLDSLDMYDEASSFEIPYPDIATDGFSVDGPIACGDEIAAHRLQGNNFADVIVDGSANGGVEESLDSTYEAFKFNTGDEGCISSFAVRLRDLTSLATNQYITGYVYSDNSGVPGTMVTGCTTGAINYFSDITTKWAEYHFWLLSLPEYQALHLEPNTSYWIVLKRSDLTGTIYLDISASGTAAYATSSNGTDWTPSDSKTPWFKIFGYTKAAIQGYSQNHYGVFGKSLSYDGVYGHSKAGFGVHGVSLNNTGVLGASTHSYGLFGGSIYGVGMWCQSDWSESLSVNSLNGIGAQITCNPPNADGLWEMLRLKRRTSGTPAAGLGGSIDCYAENSANADVLFARIAYLVSVVTASAEESAITFWTRAAGAAITEKVRVSGNGNVGIGGTAVPSAILEAVSTTQGILPPRMTSTQKGNIADPAEGLIVYDTTLHKLCVYNGSAWETVTSAVPG